MKNIKKLISIFIISFVLNAIWELLHYQLYFDLSGVSKYPHLLLATFTDAIIITIIFIIISFKNKDKNLKWINKPKKLDYIIMIISGLIVAIFIELRALRIERWAYKPIMPTILGIGLSPLLQLATTGILTILILTFLNKSRH
tara:strand:+ start:1055 stop:1483 length:429 start_codon:yes stop_codon:yes gene_type:complete